MLIFKKSINSKTFGKFQRSFFRLNKYFFKTKLNVTTTKIVIVIHGRPGQIFLLNFHREAVNV